MTLERSQRLKTLLDQAKELDEDQRFTFVAGECGDDTRMRDELLSLLTPSEIDEQFERRIDDAIASAAQRDSELLLGQSIGRYKIVRLLGRGGMGTVYLAERADKEFEQSVAIKIVNDSAMSNRIVARLRTERQILANLNHPNIARLIDGGAAGDGTPYLVMEFVEGERIDLYCRRHKLSIAQRLQLFRQVCAAVQYAHQQLVIHRDIKPSNILVTADGNVKLLDFGIAKLVDPNATQDSVLTRIHECVLTPEYASPEQVRGEQVGTASDIYVLGVLLYELLTNRKTFDFACMPFAEVERVICQQAPTKPSELISNPLLKGDLDTIVLKAMHKEASRRYVSAAALADDIDNYLCNRPITARPDSVAYRAGKFWRRNRWAVSSAAVMLVAVIALTVFYTWRLTIERDTAQRERLTATRVSDFMSEVFRVANPSESRGSTVPVREVLDAAVARIEQDLKSEPRAQVQLMQKMAQAYIGIGLWSSAGSLLKRAIDVERSAFGNTVELANILTSLAEVASKGANDTLEWDSLSEALSIRRSLNMINNREGVMTLVAWARSQSIRGNTEPALQTLREAEAIANAWNRRDPSVLGEIYAGYGSTYSNASRYVEATDYLQKAMPLLRGSIVQGADRYIDAADSLAYSFIAQGKMAQAIEFLQKMLPDVQSVFGAEHPSTSQLWNVMGIAYCESGEYEKCSEAFQKSLDIEQKLGLPVSRRLASRYSNLGSAYHDAGNLDRALGALLKARQIFISHRATDASLLSVYYELSGVYRELGKIALAEQTMAAANIIVEEQGSDNPLIGMVRVEQGRVLIAKGQFELAAKLLREALAQIAAEEKKPQANGHLALGKALLALHRCDESIAEMKTALALRTATMPTSNWFIHEAQNNLGNALSVCGKLAEAEEPLTSSVEQLRKLRRADDLRLAEAEKNLFSHQHRINR